VSECDREASTVRRPTSGCCAIGKRNSRSVVSIVTKLRAGRPGVRTLARSGNFFFLQNIQMASGACPTSYSVDTEDDLLGLRRPGWMGDRSSPSSAEVRMVGALPPLLLYACWRVEA
jgi:hypothetical protein